MSEVNEIQVKIQEVQVQKLELKDGDTLLVTIKGDEMSESRYLESLGDSFKKLFPNNKVALVGVGSDGDIKYSVMKSVAKPVTASYCNDCSCGKKEAFEEQNG